MCVDPMKANAKFKKSWNLQTHSCAEPIQVNYINLQKPALSTLPKIEDSLHSDVNPREFHNRDCFRCWVTTRYHEALLRLHHYRIDPLTTDFLELLNPTRTLTIQLTDPGCSRPKRLEKIEKFTTVSCSMQNPVNPVHPTWWIESLLLVLIVSYCT